MSLDKPPVIEESFILRKRIPYTFYMARESLAVGDEGNPMINGVEYPMGKTAIDDGVYGPYEYGCDQYFSGDAFIDYTDPPFWLEPDPEYYGEIYWNEIATDIYAWVTPSTFDQGARLYPKQDWRWLYATKIKLIFTPSTMWFRVADGVGDNVIGPEAGKTDPLLITSGVAYDFRVGETMAWLSFESNDITISEILFGIPEGVP